MHKTMFQRPDHLHGDKLYVVTTLFNSARYRTRWEHYQDFVGRVEQAGAVLYTVEVAFGDREFLLEEHPHHIRLRSRDEMWLKENAINVGVQHLTAAHPEWKYVAWVDADVRFLRDDWADETKHRLQHYDVVQMWSQYEDLTDDYEFLQVMPSFAAVYTQGGPRKERGKYGYGSTHTYPGAPGLAWAATRTAWNTMGGLLDVTILGAGDWYMAHGLVGELYISGANHPSYVKAAYDWQERALGLRKNMGVVPGLAAHFWHGPKAHRKYGTREKILVETAYDPTRHISRSASGIYQFTAQAPIALRDRVRSYLHERKEDA